MLQWHTGHNVLRWNFDFSFNLVGVNILSVASKLVTYMMQRCTFICTFIYKLFKNMYTYAYHYKTTISNFHYVQFLEKYRKNNTLPHTFWSIHMSKKSYWNLKIFINLQKCNIQFVFRNEMNFIWIQVIRNTQITENIMHRNISITVIK